MKRKSLEQKCLKNGLPQSNQSYERGGKALETVHIRQQGTEKYLPPPPREQEKIIFRRKLWFHPTLR